MTWIPKRWNSGRALRAALLLYGVAVLVATLVPAPSSAGQLPEQALCLFCGSRGVADAVLNVFMFVPFGVLPLAILEREARSGAVPGILAAGVLLSLAIEVVQSWIPGRHASPADLLFNSAGVALGVLVIGPVLLRAARVLVVRRTLALVWTAGVIAYWVLASLAFQPTVPDGTLYGQWTPDLGGFDVYRGRVVSASIGGIPLPSSRAPSQIALRRRLQGGAPIRLRFVAGAPPDDLAPVLNVYDHRGRHSFVLGVRGDDLVFVPRLRADDLRLDRPELSLRGALAEASPGDTVHVEVARTEGSTFRLGADGSVGTRGHSVGRTWALLLYTGGGSPLREMAMDALWLALLGLPLGLLGFGTGRIVPAGVLALFGGLVAIPAVSGLVVTPWWQYAALFFGVLLGSGYCLAHATLFASRGG